MAWLIGKTSDFSKEEYERAYKSLSPARKARIDRLKKTEDKKRSLACELLIKKLLSSKNKAYLSVDSAENGRPFLRGSQLYISLSHSNDCVACAFSQAPIGIDVEKIRPVKAEVIKRVCTEEEEAFVLCGDETVSEITDRETLKRFFKVWTAKEAYFKALGTGITNLKSVNTLTLDTKLIEKDGFIIAVVEIKL